MGEPFELRAARVYPADGSPVLAPGFVTVDGDQITGVGKGVSGQPLPTLDFGEATILPGLIDAHCHITLTGDGTTYEDQVLDPDEMMTLIAASNLRRHLRSGVTTIRDNGGRNRTTFIAREAIARGYIEGPRLLLAGRPVTHSYGHFYWCNGEADGEVEIRAAVRRLVAEGADHIKIMASGGATLGNIPYYPSYLVEELRWAVDAAHALQRPTTAHCRSAQSMINAVEAGSDCIEHAEFLVPGEMLSFGGGVAKSSRMVYDAGITDKILEAGTYVSFTLQAGGIPTLLDLRKREAQGEVLMSSERERRDALEAFLDMKLEILRRLLSDGMTPRLMISTDAGPFDVAFGALQIGMELAVEAGMSPREAIDAATRIASEACGIANVAGSIKPTMSADLLVVDGDPLRDIADLWRVRQVYARGEPVLAQVN